MGSSLMLVRERLIVVPSLKVRKPGPAPPVARLKPALSRRALAAFRSGPALPTEGSAHQDARPVQIQASGGAATLPAAGGGAKALRSRVSRNAFRMSALATWRVLRVT